MTAVRFEAVDDRGVVRTPPEGGMCSVHESADPADVARDIIDGAPRGTRCRLWRNVDLVGSLESLGEPAAVVMMP